MKHPIFAAFALFLFSSAPFARAQSVPTQDAVNQAEADMRAALQKLQDFNAQHGDRQKWTANDERDFTALRDNEESLERKFGDLRDALEQAALQKLTPAERVQKKLEKVALVKQGAQAMMSEFLKSHPDRSKWTAEDERTYDYFRRENQDADTQIDQLLAERQKLSDGGQASAKVRCQRVTNENVICDGDTYQRINKGVIEQLGQRLKRDAGSRAVDGDVQPEGPAPATDAK